MLILFQLQSHPEAIQYARHLLSEVSFQESGGLQLVSYDTQFKVTMLTTVMGLLI